MQVQLIRKFAQSIDGVDLTHHEVGDVFDTKAAEADLLIAEGWAIIYPYEVAGGDSSQLGGELVGSGMRPRAEVSDGPARGDRVLDRIRHARSRLDHRRLTQTESRRAEDRIREELHDARARTVGRNSRKR